MGQIKLGLKKGNVIGLVMENRPEFIITWLGLCKLGIITAFINFRLHGNSLKHIVEISNSSTFVVGTELIEKFLAINPKGPIYAFQGKCRTSSQTFFVYFCFAIRSSINH